MLETAMQLKPQDQLQVNRLIQQLASEVEGAQSIRDRLRRIVDRMQGAQPSALIGEAVSPSSGVLNILEEQVACLKSAQEESQMYLLRLEEAGMSTDA